MKKYYLHDGTAQQGPFDLEELRAKNISANTNVWFDPMPGWKPAGTIDELNSLFSPAIQDWNNIQFYYTDGGVQQGPFTIQQLKGKNIASNTPVWYDPLPKWTTAGEVAALKDVINSAAPQSTAAVNWNSVHFYYTDGGVQQGPFTIEQLKGKNIISSTPVWYDPLPKWTTAGEVAALKDVINSAAPQTTTAVNWNSVQFYYTDGGAQQGPFTIDKLKGKNITSNTPVWYDPLPKWTTAGEVAALKDVINSAAPQIATAPTDWNNVAFYFSENGIQQGPFTLSQLKGKNIISSTPVWYDPLPKWTTAGEVTALKEIISAPKVIDWNTVAFYYSENGAQQGPFNLEQLKGKNIRSATPVWYDPLPKWTTAGEVDALKDVINSAVAAGPPSPPPM